MKEEQNAMIKKFFQETGAELIILCRCETPLLFTSQRMLTESTLKLRIHELLNNIEKGILNEK